MRTRARLVDPTTIVYYTTGTWVGDQPACGVTV